MTRYSDRCVMQLLHFTGLYPASSSASEREFKQSKQITKDKARLKPANAEMLLFLKYNMKAIELRSDCRFRIANNLLVRRNLEIQRTMIFAEQSLNVLRKEGVLFLPLDTCKTIFLHHSPEGPLIHTSYKFHFNIQQSH